MLASRDAPAAVRGGSCPAGAQGEVNRSFSSSEDSGSDSDDHQGRSQGRAGLQVRVNKSSHVDFRVDNNTYFQGPVTVLKQMVVGPGPGAGCELTAPPSAPVKVDPVPVDKIGAAGLSVRWPCVAAVLAGLAGLAGLAALVAVLTLRPGAAPEQLEPMLPPPPTEEAAPAQASASSAGAGESAAAGAEARVLRVVPRQQWIAQPPTGRASPLHTPVQYVIISHSAADPCSTTASCSRLVRYIQMTHIEGNGWVDIGYNFLVGGDGSAYEGRGWDAVGAHTLGWNKESIGICFVGTFIAASAPQRQQRAARMLIDKGVRLGKLRPDYRLVAHMQLQETASPGKALYEDMKRWPHWYNKTLY